jgi:thiol-disulfide isomerase/thioredoxin
MIGSRRQSSGVSRVVFSALIAALVLSTVPASAGAPPFFRLQDLDGNWFSLDENLDGDVVYISFWATWCVPCRREMPHLQKLHEDLADKGLTVIGINTDPPGTTSKIKPFVNRYKITYETLLDPNNNVLDKYNPTRELPYAVLVDRSGNVAEIFPGYRKGDEVLLREKIVELLGSDTTTVEEAAAGGTD